MNIKVFLLGFLLGILFVLFLVSIIIYMTNKRFLKRSIEAKEIENQTIKELITTKQKQMIKSPKMGITNNTQLMQQLTKDLIQDIAGYYYPNQRYPHLEITFIEALDLNEKITERLKRLLDIKVIHLLKDVRISQIVSILETKKTIQKNKLYKLSKKYYLNKVVRYGYTAFNFSNPAYWIRRIIFTSTLETTLRSVSCMTLNIVGEEASNLYSKKVIDNRDALLEKELKKFVKSIEQEQFEY